MKQTIKEPTLWQKLIGGHRAKVQQSAREEIKSDVNKSIHISNTIINGEHVIGLMVGDVCVKHTGANTETYDPDGLMVETSPYCLIETMLRLRDAEYKRQCLLYKIPENISKEER